MERIELNETFKRAWLGRDPFMAVTQLQGKIFRAVQSRHTLRFELEGRSYFAKIHWGVGWREILKNWLYGKTPILSALNEYQAIRHLESIDVDTMTCVAFGQRGRNPARQQSFIITEALTDTLSLETVCRQWLSSPPAPTFKRRLIRRVARMARLMHNSGMNHRDYYLCHFLLKPASRLGTEEAEFRVHLIDLHRAQIRQTLPLRWRQKDLAGLYFSTLDFPFTRTDLLRFVREYEQCPLTDVFQQRGRHWRTVGKKAIRLYQKQFGRTPNTCL